MKSRDITRRGVYLNLNKSPFTFCVNGDLYRFSSKKKLEIYCRKYEEFKVQLEKILLKFDYIGEDWINKTRPVMIKHYQKELYMKVEDLTLCQTTETENQKDLQQN